jgi:hypothetical protein
MANKRKCAKFKHIHYHHKSNNTLVTLKQLWNKETEDHIRTQIFIFLTCTTATLKYICVYISAHHEFWEI